ncbi:MAG TPA: hypothetical protein VEJ22_04045 [Nitrospirota bacterium]|nr:hypothetical protein [Nitrospirota bacterium]
MDRVAILCDKDKNMMYSFSRRSLNRAAEHPLKLASLPFFSTYMDANVRKEVDKDRLIIEVAAGKYYKGKPVCDLDLEDVFEKTKHIDKVFLNHLIIPAISFHVRYSDFADIRIQRIWLISKTVYALLANWPASGTFTDAVRFAYTGTKFKARLMEILHLYNEETRILSNSLRLFGPLNKAVATYAEAMYKAMEEITGEITDVYTKKIYGEVTVHAQA